MKILGIAILGIVAISTAHAGTIEIGGGVVGGISTTGLTASYIGGTPTWLEKNYVTNLFSQSVVRGTLPTALNGLQQFTDTNNGVTFAMMSDGPASPTSTTAYNFWASGTGTGTSTPSSIVVPISSYSGINRANLLLNEYWGVSGSTTETVTFSYSGHADVSFTLTSGVQIGSALVCPGASPTDTTAPLCTTFGQPTSSLTDNAFTGTYTNTTSSLTNPFSNTTTQNANNLTGAAGTANLEDIRFDLSAASSFALTGITVTDNSNLSGTSRLALSAVTLTTPEPSTIAMLFGGFGLMLLGLKRKRVRQ